jgi:hypothetical protein
MLEIVLVGIVLISYIGILHSISKERPKPKLLIFCLIIFLIDALCIAGIEIYNTYNTPATFGFEEHDYIINSQGIIEHSINCHCYD